MKEEKAKVITMCGSLKYKYEFIRMSEKLELDGNCVLSVVYPTKENKDCYTKSEVDILDRMHKQRIAMSDAIFVVNVDGYIGSSTKSEIEYAKSLGKEILYLESIN